MSPQELANVRLGLRASSRRLLEHRAAAVAAGDGQLATDLYDAHALAIEVSELPDEALEALERAR